MTSIFLNNQLIPEHEFQLSLNDRGLMLGDGLFETMRVYAGNVPFLRDHWERLNQGAKILNLKLPFTEIEFKNSVSKILSANELEHQDAVLRLTVTRGPGARGISLPAETKPTTILTATNRIPDKKDLLSAHIVQIRRNEYSPLSNIKSLNYLENILARQQALQYGADEALLFNTKNYLAEASVANVFIVLNNVLHTPFLQDGALAGIVRKKIFTLADKIQWPMTERHISRDDLFQATEVFLTNSLLEIVPVIKIDKNIVAKGTVGQITQKLKQLYAHLINEICVTT